MRVAFVKHVLEPHGPWATVRAADNDLALWPSKVTFWSPTEALHADWYVVDCEIPWKSAHYGNICQDDDRIALMHRHSQGVMAPEDVPVEEYDLVISLYPWIKPTWSRGFGNTLFAYMIQEHWDPLFIQSTRRVMGGYDLHLDFMFSSAYDLEKLPQSVAFPFPKFLRGWGQALGDVERDGAAWIDGRVLLQLTGEKVWNGEESTKAAESVAKVLGVPLRYRGGFWERAFGLADPPSWGDGRDYLRDMASCKYYINYGRTYAPGEAICDAAALGCICIGDSRKLYHRMICHPLCMIEQQPDLKAVAWQLFDSPQLQTEALEHQDRMLRHHFQQRPMDILHRALELKEASLNG